MQELAWAWVPWLYNKGIYITDLTLKKLKSLYNALSYDSEWIFLINKPTPISKQLFDISDINPIKIKWNASTNPPKFRDTSINLQQWKHISYLSFTVTLSDKSSHDLTNWINDVKWIGISEPTPLEIFTLWCCEVGSPYYFDLDGASLEVMTGDGDIVKRGLNEFTRTIIYEDGFSEDNRQDSNRFMDTLLSSSGR